MNWPLIAAGVVVLVLPYLTPLIRRIATQKPTTQGVEGEAGSPNFAPASPPPEGCAEFCSFMQETLPNESAADILFYLTQGLSPHRALKQAYAGGPEEAEKSE